MSIHEFINKLQDKLDELCEPYPFSLTVTSYGKGISMNIVSKETKRLMNLDNYFES